MARLVRGVWVDGQHYGPGSNRAEPPEDVARQITNPLAWENGEVPFPAEESAGGSSATGTPSQSPEASQRAEKGESEPKTGGAAAADAERGEQAQKRTRGRPRKQG